MIDLAAYKIHVKSVPRVIANRRGNIANEDSISLFGDASLRGFSREPPKGDDDNDNEDPPELRHRSRKLKYLVDSSSRASARPQTLFSQCGYMHEDDIPTDEQLMLCLSHVWGYSFREKDWGTMHALNWVRG